MVKESAIVGTIASGVFIVGQLVPSDIWDRVEKHGPFAIFAFIAGLVCLCLFRLYRDTKNREVEKAELREKCIGELLDAERMAARNERKEQHEKVIGAMGELTGAVNGLKEAMISKATV